MITMIYLPSQIPVEKILSIAKVLNFSIEHLDTRECGHIFSSKQFDHQNEILKNLINVLESEGCFNTSNYEKNLNMIFDDHEVSFQINNLKTFEILGGIEMLRSEILNKQIENNGFL